MRLPHFTSTLVVFASISGLGAAATTPASAATCSDLDMVVAAFVSHGASVYMIPNERLQLVAHDAEQLTGSHYAGVTRGFLVKGKAGFVLGFEIGGCLLDPIQLHTPLLYTAEIGAA